MKTFTFATSKTFRKVQILGISMAALLLAGCGGSAIPQDETDPEPTPTQQQTQQTMASTIPAESWTLHMTAKKLFPGNAEMTVNKYCKSVVGNMTQCQLFDGNEGDSRLVGVETMVGPEMYGTFTQDEKKLWMPTKDLMLSTMTAMPDLDAEQFTNVAQSLSNKYSKVYLLWDPGRINLPTGSPIVTVMNTAVASGTTLTPPPGATPPPADANAAATAPTPAPAANPADKNGFTFGAYDTSILLGAALSDVKGNFEDSILQRNGSGSLELYKLKGNIGNHTYENTTLLVFVLSGKGVFTIGDKKQDVVDGSVVIIPAGVAMTFQNSNDKAHPLTFVTFKTPFDDTNVKWQ